MDNKNSEKLLNESKYLFLKYIKLMNNDKKIMYLFYKLLFNDLILTNIKKDLTNNKTIKLNNLYNNPENILRNKLNNVFNKINNANISRNRLKDIYINKIKELKNKIIECDKSLNILKNEYFYYKISKYTPTNNSNNFVFINKTVLNMYKDNNDLDYLYLGEFFARFIFSIIEQSNNKNLESIFNNENFYNDSQIESYINTSNNQHYVMNDFNNIHPNFKYIIILFYITSQLFNKESNYDILFNNKEFILYLTKLINDSKIKKYSKYERNDKHSKYDKYGKKNEKKMKKKLNFFKKFKIGGKGFNLQNILKKSLENIIDNNNNNNNRNNRNRNVINSKLNSNNIRYIYIKLFKINKLNKYLINFKNNMKKYFKQELNYSNNQTLLSKISIKDPFENDYINFLSLFNLNKKDKQKYSSNKLDKLNSNNIFNFFNYDIFNSLNLLLDDSNKNEINIFLNKVKYNLILLLYYLYVIKKRLYKFYIKYIINKFDINESKIETSKENSKKKLEKPILKIPEKSSKLNIEYKKTNLINKDKESILLMKLEKRKIKIQDKKGIKKYADELLLIDSEIKKILIKKYSEK
jgi:hypothetical protein